MQGGVASAASVLIYTTGQAANNANVTLTGPSSLSLPLTLFENLSAGGEYIDYYYSATGWTYTPNQNYTMTVSYGGMTFQSSITSVGGVVFTPVTSGTKGVSITWSGGGNENTAMAIGSGDYTYGPNITSPYFISQSSLAGYTAGSYDIQMNADETKTSAFSGGAFTASSFTASDQESTTY